MREPALAAKFEGTPPPSTALPGPGETDGGKDTVEQRVHLIGIRLRGRCIEAEERSAMRLRHGEALLDFSGSSVPREMQLDGRAATERALLARQKDETLEAFRELGELPVGVRGERILGTEDVAGHDHVRCGGLPGARRGGEGHEGLI